MYAITVIVGNVPFTLMWKSEEKAEESIKMLNPLFQSSPEDWIVIIDDFGHRLACYRKSLIGYIFENMEQSKLAHCERTLHQQKTQNLAQKMAEADPGLRASRMVNGPMLSPFPQQH